MTKKREKPKTAKDINVGGGAYIGGNVNTGGGDFVGRDKVVHGDLNSVVIHGDAKNNTIVTGSGNVVSTGGKSEEVSLNGMIELVKQIRAALPQTGLQNNMVVVIDREYQSIQAALEEPEPQKFAILPKLKSALEMLVLAGGASQAVQQLLPVGQKVVEWAQQVLK